jgi:hypothetical protein
MEGGYHPEDNLYGIGQYQSGDESPLTLPLPCLFTRSYSYDPARKVM